MGRAGNEVLISPWSLLPPTPHPWQPVWDRTSSPKHHTDGNPEELHPFGDLCSTQHHLEGTAEVKASSILIKQCFQVQLKASFRFAPKNELPLGSFPPCPWSLTTIAAGWWSQVLLDPSRWYQWTARGLQGHHQTPLPGHSGGSFLKSQLPMGRECQAKRQGSCKAKWRQMGGYGDKSTTSS